MADELIDSVLAGTVVEAWVGRALIDIRKTASIVVSARASASEPIHQVHTNPVIGAWIACTFVDVRFAVLTRETRHAFTRIPKKSGML